MPARMVLDAFFLDLGQEAFMNGLSNSLSRVLRSDEAGYLCRPGEGGHVTMRTEQCKAQHISLTVPGHQERIALGHVHDEVKKFVRHPIFRIGSEAVLHVVVEDINYRFSILFETGVIVKSIFIHPAASTLHPKPNGHTQAGMKAMRLVLNRFKPILPANILETCLISINS